MLTGGGGVRTDVFVSCFFPSNATDIPEIFMLFFSRVGDSILTQAVGS